MSLTPRQTHTVFFDVDAAYCISLRDRSDRRELFQKKIQQFVSNTVNFFLVDKAQNPQQGCFQSHRAVAQNALHNNFKRILVFEDDAARYFKLKQKNVSSLNKFISNNSFEILHLGYSMGKIWLTWHPGVARGSVVALHAYILSEEGCRKILAQTYANQPIDRVIRRKLKQHCAFPMLFKQLPAQVAGSDIEAQSINENQYWRNNWRRHIRSVRRNFLMTIFRWKF